MDQVDNSVQIYNDCNSLTSISGDKTMAELFSYVTDSDNNYKKCFYLDDTNNITDWTGIRLRYCTLSITRFNSTLANIYLYGVRNQSPNDPKGYILSLVSGTVFVQELITEFRLKSGETFIQKGIYSESNFNNHLESGMYYVSGECTNAPISSGTVYGVLCVFNGRYGYIYQVHLCIGAQMIYYRSSSTNGKNWNPWRTVISEATS